MPASKLRAPRGGWREMIGREIGPLLALLFVALAVLAFLGLADEVGEGGTHQLDFAILQALHSTADPKMPIGPWWFNEAATDLTALGSITDLGLVLLLIAGLFVVQRRWGAALGLVGTGAGGIAMSQGLKLVFGRDRPPMQYHAVEAINSSFPSGHAMLSAIIYLTLGAIAARLAHSRPMKIYAMSSGVLATLLVGCSRVYLGVHWATDVVGGWCLGAAWATTCWLLAWAWLRFGSRKARRVGAETGA